MSEQLGHRGDQPEVPAVILRTRALRESDLIVVLLTPDRGKVDCIARGARRSRKRFPGGLPSGGRGVAVIESGRGSLAVLSSFSPTVDHGVLGRSLEIFAYVNYLCELADHFVEGGGADPAMFAGLCEALEDAIEHAASPLGPAVLRRFELGLLDGFGLLPALRSCSVCGSPRHETDEGVAFSRERGGVLCLAHARMAPRISAELLELAEILLHAPPEQRASSYAAAPPGTRRQLRDLCRELIYPHLRAPLRSLAFFAQISGKPPEPYE